MGCYLGIYCFGSDMKTIKGAVFDHKGETAGLGAEITQQWFQDRFVGETIFDLTEACRNSSFQNK